MSLRELSFGIPGWVGREPLFSILLAQFAAPSGRRSDVINFQRSFRVRITFERLGWIGHLERIFQSAEFSQIADAMAFEWFDDFEFCAACVVSVVILYLRPLKHEADGSVGKIETRGHLRVT